MATVTAKVNDRMEAATLPYMEAAATPPPPPTAEDRAAEYRQQSLQDPDLLKGILGVVVSDAFELSTRCRQIISRTFAQQGDSMDVLQRMAPAFNSWHKCAHQLASITGQLAKYDKRVGN